MGEGPSGPTSGPSSSAAAFLLDDWIVEPSLNKVSRGEQSVHVRRQLMDLLVFLASRPGQVVPKEDIFRGVWPGQFVAETGLARCISQLRDVFGDDAKNSRIIETIPTRGYRIVALVQPVASPAQRLPSSLPAPSPASASGGTAEVLAAHAVAAATIEAEPATVPAPRRGRVAIIFAAGCLAIVAAAATWRWWPASIEGRDSLVIAFENRTGDKVFDETLRLALARQLEQSPYLRVVPEGRVRAELGFMKRPDDTPLTRPVALEVCQRVGAEVTLLGSAASLGRHYVIGLEGIECVTGRVLAREQVEVDGKEQVLAGLGTAASSIRKRLGESAASISRHDVPIAQATTASLEALKAFSQADLARARGRDEDAVRLLRQATLLDPSFAMAHLRLGLQLLNLSRTGEGAASLKTAYSMADRASAAERLYITSSYYNRVLRDPVKAVEPLESWRDTFPRSAIARFSLASLYLQVGRLEDALREAEEACRLEPDNAIAMVVHGEALLYLGRFAEAKRVGSDLVGRYPDSVNGWDVLADLAILQNDREALERWRQWAASTPAAANALLNREYLLAASRGQFKAASRLAARWAALGEQRGDRLLVALVRLQEATDLAQAGKSAEALPAIRAALLESRMPEVVIAASLAFALAGEFEEAEKHLKEYAGMPDVVAASDPDCRPELAAWLSIARGAPEAALDQVAALRPYERGWRFGLRPAYVRGNALMRLRRFKEAAAEYERIVRLGGSLPHRIVYPLSWLQLARARSAAGDSGGAREAYGRFLELWKDGDPDLPVLLQAKAELAAIRE